MLMSFCMTGAVFAQKAVIKGNVVDENGEPIIGANILVKGSTNGTITDIFDNTFTYFIGQYAVIFFIYFFNIICFIYSF